MKTVAFHSYKGGTGKSYLSSNLAATYAAHEKVCLIDMDLAAPTLHRLFNLEDRDIWINDYLDGESSLSDVLIQVNGGKLYLCTSNPEPEAIRAALGKSKEREMKSLKRLLLLKQKIEEEGFDRLILDTTPGYEYSSINSIAAADVVGIVTILYRPDMLGARQLITGLYDVLEKPAFMIINRYHSESLYNDHVRDLKDVFKGGVHGMKCFCDIAEVIGNQVIALEDPKHPLSKSFRGLARAIDNGVSGK